MSAAQMQVVVFASVGAVLDVALLAYTLVRRARLRAAGTVQQPATVMLVLVMAALLCVLVVIAATLLG